MSLFTAEQIDVIRKYFPCDDRYRCIRCVYAVINDDECEVCGLYCDESDTYDEDDCKAFHSGRECSVCYFEFARDEYPSRSKITYEILKIMLLNSGGCEAFIEVYSALKSKKSCLNEIFIEALKQKQHDKADFLITCGADINYTFNSSILLPGYLGYDPQSMRYLCQNGYDFLQKNEYHMNPLDKVISAYVSIRECQYGSYLSHIKTLLPCVGWKQFQIRVISGNEYGDTGRAVFNQHHWRRNRIEELIELGMPYDLNKCCKRMHPKCDKCKLLKSTRLGYYLIWREHRQYIRACSNLKRNLKAI